MEDRFAICGPNSKFHPPKPSPPAAGFGSVTAYQRAKPVFIEVLHS